MKISRKKTQRSKIRDAKNLHGKNTLKEKVDGRKIAMKNFADLKIRRKFLGIENLRGESFAR